MRFTDDVFRQDAFLRQGNAVARVALVHGIETREASGVRDDGGAGPTGVVALGEAAIPWVVAAHVVKKLLRLSGGFRGLARQVVA
jgi:hypothetical protein